MNTQFKFSFLSLTIVIFLLACNKSGKTDQQLHPAATTSLSISEARAWFTQEIKTNNIQVIATSGPAKYFNIPDWGNAVYERGANHISYWRIPLNSKDKITRTVTIYESGKKQKLVMLPDPWLLIYQDSVKQTKMLVMQTIPDSLDKAKSRGFAGEVKMYHWNGDFEVGFIYENGKKQRQIISTRSNRRRPADPNARWENVCKDYIDCEFEAQCSGYTSSGFYLHMAYASVRVELSCYTPNDDPYASAWSSDPGVGWSCTSWSPSNTTHVNVCDYVWVEDIPEPEPYIPDPTVNSEGYGVQTIDNKLKDPCHKETANDLMAHRMMSDIVEKAQRIFGVSRKVNLTFHDRDQYAIDYPNTPWQENWNGATGTKHVGDKMNVTIYLNSSKFAHSSKEAVFQVFQHELIHAILVDEGNYTEDAEHELMALKYFEEMTAVMMDMFGMSEQDAKLINLTGLGDTVLGATLANVFPQQYEQARLLFIAYRTGVIGSKCN